MAGLDRGSVAALGALLAVALAGAARADVAEGVAATDGTLVVRTRPHGAPVRVDGLLVGVTPLELSVRAGDHVVAIDQPGYHIVVRDVAIERGGVATVDVDLVRAGGPLARPRFGVWKWVALGTGAAAIAGGVVLLALDEPEVKDGTRRPERYETTAAGYATGAVGVALVVTGGVMWALDRRGERRAAARDVTAVAAPVPGGAVVGVGGRF